MSLIKVYTDGACSGNPGPGGFAAIIIDDTGKEHIVSGGEKNTTNNRMELIALIESLRLIRNRFVSVDNQNTFEFYLDSQYVLKGATEWLEAWKRKNWKSSTGKVKNRELWEEIDLLIKGLPIKWIWVRGHNGNEYNEKADQIAVAEIMRK